MFEDKNCSKKSISLPNNCYLIGPTGPAGSSDTIEFRNVITGEPGSQAEIIDNTGSPNHILDLIIPKGDTGPTGPSGTSVNILGSYDTYDDLIKEHQTGTPDDSYLVNGDLYVWSDNTKSWQNVGRIQGPSGEIGPIGPTGPTGPAGISRAAYLVLYNHGTNPDGIAITSNNRIPIERNELDMTNLVTLNSDNTLKFNTVGYYKITFTVSAYTIPIDIVFDEHRDFVSLGLRQLNTDNIYIGASEWIYDSTATQVIAQGILSVENPSNIYELVNLGKYTIYLNTPDLNDINSNSYFVNSLATIVVEYLGRQGR